MDFFVMPIIVPTMIPTHPLSHMHMGCRCCATTNHPKPSYPLLREASGIGNDFLGWFCNFVKHLIGGVEVSGALRKALMNILPDYTWKRKVFAQRTIRLIHNIF